MSMTFNRREFLATTGTLAAGATLAGDLISSAGAAAPVRSATPSAEKLGWQLSMAMYTFRRFPFYQALDKVVALGVTAVEPAFFLKLDQARPKLTTGDSLAAEERAELKQKLAAAGIKMRSYYSNVGSDEAAARKAFTFAKEMGVQTIIAEPPAEAFAMVDRLCAEFQINVAIHNHPKSPQSKYWNPEHVLAVCKGRSPRIGGCCDTGHWVRSGLKPVECLKKMEGRIISMHLKDVGEWDKPAARDVPLGTGLADYAAVLKELKRQGFRGLMAIEYEHDTDKLVDEVAECIAFLEKTARSLSAA
jgi:sugar phosphate isomerase/epimerase